ncbi:hypothetical protein SAMN05421796_102143 [Chryseobacterium piscicola]|uniref:Uncharacterized protein n=1 Tax=Chryseobacterium piscicola TaxID=551459 RepID=A0A1N7LA37_9FLAO|nr:hypothetical protein [Chryseobacterium piscicola]SIS70663.1 hypothetical protein SAMN05421796_102143 [Chryseobacterium piscicola]
MAKVKNGTTNFAVITLVINESNTDENFVNEYYSGDGFPDFFTLTFTEYE